MEENVMVEEWVEMKSEETVGRVSGKRKRGGSREKEKVGKRVKEWGRGMKGFGGREGRG